MDVCRRQAILLKPSTHHHPSRRTTQVKTLLATLTLTTLNFATPQTLHYNFKNLNPAPDATISVTGTQTKSKTNKLITTTAQLQNSSLHLNATPDTLYTLIIPNITL